MYDTEKYKKRLKEAGRGEYNKYADVSTPFWLRDDLIKINEKANQTFNPPQSPVPGDDFWNGLLAVFFLIGIIFCGGLYILTVPSPRNPTYKSYLQYSKTNIPFKVYRLSKVDGEKAKYSKYTYVSEIIQEIDVDAIIEYFERIDNETTYKLEPCKKGCSFLKQTEFIPLKNLPNNWLSKPSEEGLKKNMIGPEYWMMKNDYDYFQSEVRWHNLRKELDDFCNTLMSK